MRHTNERQANKAHVKRFAGVVNPNRTFDFNMPRLAALALTLPTKTSRLFFHFIENYEFPDFQHVPNALHIHMAY